MEASETVREPGRPWPAAGHESRLIVLVLAMLTLSMLAPGCTQHRLQINTASQAQTVVDLQYQQILDNLALFCLNPATLPSLISLKTGASQVGDTGTLGFVGTAGLNTRFGSSPTLAGTRTIVDQWGSAPVTDDNNLLLVRKAFRQALGIPDLISESDANDLAHDLSTQIGTTADMSVDRDTLGHIFSQAQVTATLARVMPPDPVRRNPSPGTLDQRSLDRAQRSQLQLLATRLADVNNLIDRDITDTLDGKIVAEALAFDYDSSPYLEPVEDAKEFPGEGEDENAVYLARAEGGLLVRIFDEKGMLWPDIPLSAERPDVRELIKIYERVWARGELYARERREIIKRVAQIVGLTGRMKERFEPVATSSTGLAKETINRLNDAQETLGKIRPGWYHVGPEPPKDACYVGHACFCGQECYVWVCRDGMDALADFTRKVLKLGSTFKDVQVVTAPTGIQFSPALTNTPR